MLLAPALISEAGRQITRSRLSGARGLRGGDASVPCVHPSCGAGNKPGLRFQGLQDKRKIVPRDYKARN